MTINIIEHLENIKIFTDYIKSGLDSIEMFWVQIDKGNSGKNKKVMKFNTNDYDPTEKELEQLLDDKKRKEHFDLSEEYTKVISDKILTKLEYDKATVPDKIELSELYEKIIEENGNLQEFLNTTKDIVDQYVEIIGADLPKNFFGKLSQVKKDNADKPIDYQIDESNDNNSNDFSGLEWGAIFYYSTNFSPNTNYGFKRGDLINFMGKHKIDKKYKYLRKQCFIALNRINKENNYPIEKLNKIIPFLKVNYPQAISKVNNDINIITEETTDF